MEAFTISKELLLIFSEYTPGGGDDDGGGGDGGGGGRMSHLPTPIPPAQEKIYP